MNTKALLVINALMILCAAGCSNDPRDKDAAIMGVVGVAIMGGLLGLAVWAFLRSNRKLCSINQRVYELSATLQSDPANKAAYRELSQLATSEPRVAKSVYDIALIAVESTKGDASAKKLAVDAGRIHFGSMRIGKRPTIYDEQAIQNDIQSRVS